MTGTLLPQNFITKDWTLISDFTENWTASSGSTALTTDGAVVGSQCRTWQTTAGAQGELTYPNPLPADKQFVLNKVKTIGLLIECDSDTASTVHLYCANTSFAAANNKDAQFLAAGYSSGLRFLVLDVDTVAAEWPGGAAWAFTAPFTNTTTMLRLVCGSASAVQNYKLHGIYVGGRSRPKVMIGFDMWAKASANIYEVVYPTMAAYGWKGYLAPPLDGYSSLTASDIANTKALFAAGWDVLNHSNTHQTPTQLGNYSAIYADYKTAKDTLASHGFGLTSNVFGAWPQNVSSATAKRAVRALGYKMFRGLGSWYHAPAPVDDTLSFPMETPSVDLSQHTGAENIALIRAAVRMGVSINLFTHSVYQTGDLVAPNDVDPGTGARMNSPFNYDIWESNWDLVRAEVRRLELLGLCDVCTPSEYYYGLKNPRRAQ